MNFLNGFTSTYFLKISIMCFGKNLNSILYLRKLRQEEVQLYNYLPQWLENPRLWARA